MYECLSVELSGSRKTLLQFTSKISLTVDQVSIAGKTQHDTTPASGLCNGIIVDFMDGLVCIYPRHDSDRRRERAQARSAARLRIGAAHDHLCARRHHASALAGGDSIGKGAQPRRPARQRTGSRLVRTWLRRAQSTEYPAVEHNTRLVGRILSALGAASPD